MLGYLSYDPGKKALTRFDVVTFLCTFLPMWCPVLFPVLARTHRQQHLQDSAQDLRGRYERLTPREKAGWSFR